MSGPGRGEVYEIHRSFRVPLDFAFRWCTDYTSADGRISKEGNDRQILRRGRGVVVYEDLYPSPHGWMWSRQTVRLYPPDRWTATASGNYRTWRLVYTLRPAADGSTQFTMRGLRRPTLLGLRNPSQRAMKAELQRMWSQYGRAMEADYRKLRRRTRT